MVVNINSTRQKLIALLKNSKEPQSGEKISEELGISRVAVWKQVGKLEEMGYQISSSRRGYQLSAEPDDALLPHLFKGQETFYCLKEVDSTMNYADRVWSKKRASEDFIVTAERQTAGRGRHQRDWISREGGLFFTHAMKTRVASARSYQHTMAALISLAEILRDEYKQPAQIKWPNDILIEDKKVMGLLSTGRVEGEVVSQLNLGIGINVNNTAPLPGSTCSLSALRGESLSRSDLMKSYLAKMAHYRREDDHRALTRRFRSLTILPQSPLTVELTRGGFARGRAREIDITGALILDSGEWIYPGDCQKIVKTQ